jgi:hypothetical protein
MTTKIFTKFLAVFSLCAFTACDQNDENEYVPNNALEGRWELYQIGTPNFQNIVYYTNAATDCDLDAVVFEGTEFSITDYVFADGNCSSSITEGSFTLVDGNIVFDNPALTSVWDVYALTNTMLEVVVTENNSLKFHRYRKVVQE